MKADEDDSPPFEMPQILDPLRQVSGQFYYVNARAGAQKTRTAIRHAIKEYQTGGKFIIAMPTEKLINETLNKTIPFISKELKLKVKPEVIHSNTIKGSVPEAIAAYIGRAEGGQILLVTHEGMLRVVKWPQRAEEWHLIIDEVFDPFLSSGVLKMRFSGHDVGPKYDPEGWTMGCFIPLELQTTFGAEGTEKDYYHIAPRFAQRREDKPEDEYNPWVIVESHVYGQDNDQVYEIFKDAPLWLLQKESLFTHKANWNRLMAPAGFHPAPDGNPNEKPQKPTLKKGHFIISGFRRPDRLLKFNSVTIMSALFDSTILQNIWSKLGIEFKESPDIKVDEKTLPLGSRHLKIGYLTDAAWSKRSRDKSGGIETLFKIIAEARIIKHNKPVGITINNDDKKRLHEEPDPYHSIKQYFPNYELLPHNVRGSNAFMKYSQLIYLAALNSNSPDIQWAEKALGIDSVDQRIGRVGHEIYQAFTRLSVRLDQGKEDVILVVPEKTIAEWLVQHFTPTSQIELVAIDDGGQIYKPKENLGRPVGIKETTKRKERSDKKQTPKTPEEIARRNKQVADNMRRMREREKAKTAI